MDADAKLPLSHKRRSGSDTRQKQRRITFRMTAEEYATVEVAAGESEVTVGTYVRDCILKAPQTRRRRRPSTDVAALSRLHRELNRIGGNINQIARRVNFGETPIAAEFHDALKGCKESMAAIRAAMGMEA